MKMKGGNINHKTKETIIVIGRINRLIFFSFVL